MSVLIISHDWAIQNVVAQVCMTCGYHAIVAWTLQEAQAKLAQLGPEALALIVIDTTMLGEGGTDLQHQVRHLLETWTEQYPSLPMVFLGTSLQKYAILAARVALVPFVTMPFSPHDLKHTVQQLLPQGRQPSPRSSMNMRTADQIRRDGSMPEPSSEASSSCGS